MARLIYGRMVRATLDERQRQLPGDELVVEAAVTATHAVTVRGAPELVWPWLVQMGGGRAGWYSYDRFDNGGVPSAEVIVEELQHLAVGDVMPALPGTSDAFVVVDLDEARHLILGVPTEEGPLRDSWCFVLEPCDGGTRLITRARLGFAVVALSKIGVVRLPNLLARLIAIPVHFAMQQKQLLGIRRRADTASPVVIAGRGKPSDLKSWHPFRSEEAKQTYLAAYDKRARRWPAASESQLTATSFGEVFVRVQGPSDGPPLVLLPGDAENSLAWLPVIEALSAKYRTYAVDHVFDNGRSVYTRPLKRPDDFVHYLDELFIALDLEEVRFVAHSYGAWQAALYALAHPERLEKLVLLAPSATVLRPPLGLLVRAILYGLLPLRFVTKRYLYWYAPDAVGDKRTRQEIDAMIEEELLARRCFKRRKFIPPTVLSDEEWQKLAIPTLFVVGENDVTYSAHRAGQRLAAVAPRVKTLIADGADHHLTIVKPDWISKVILSFLNDD